MDERLRPRADQDDPEFEAPARAEYLRARAAQKRYLDRVMDFSPVYLRDGWNVLDFVVVLGTWVTYVPYLSVSNLTVIRTVRVLRPLRTISALPGMRVLVGTIIRSIPMIGNVLLMCFFLFLVFGILGLEVFSGAMRNRCFVLDALGEPKDFGIGTPTDNRD